MTYLVLGSVAFFLYYLYDLNIAFFRNNVLRTCFCLGTVLLFIASTGLFLTEREYSVSLIRMAAGGLAAMTFFGLLIYTLFFALPVSEAYSGKSDGKMMVYQEGIYALCRHPGVLWFWGTYLSAAAALGGKMVWMGAIWFSFLDLIYVILQDMVIFPRQFGDYESYKKKTPFLIPNGDSFKKAFAGYRGEKESEV